MYSRPQMLCHLDFYRNIQLPMLNRVRLESGLIEMGFLKKAPSSGHLGCAADIRAGRHPQGPQLVKQKGQRAQAGGPGLPTGQAGETAAARFLVIG